MNYVQTNFRAYDIRGEYPSELNEENVEVLGKALGSIFHEKQLKKIVVGRDNRVHSEVIAQSMIKGLISTGCDVTYTGITTHPGIHYFTFIGYDGGVNITASHNPMKFTGIKVDYKDARPFFGDDLQNLYSRALQGNFIQGVGSYTEQDLNAEYIKMLSSSLSLKKSIKLTLDCGGGATCVVAPQVFNNVGTELHPVFCNLDDIKTHDIPNPELVSFLNEIGSYVKKDNTQFGIGFDGDGDRVGFIDEKGYEYKVDEIVQLLAKFILLEHPGEVVIYDVKCSQMLEKTIKKYGGVPKIMRTGRGFFLEEMFHKNAILGVELAGHLYFGDKFYGFDDGIYAALRVLEIMDKTGKPLSVLMSEFPKMANTPELKVPCPDEKKFELIEELQNNALKNPDYLNVITVDGIRVKISETGWFLIRASNTSPYLSVRIEGLNNDEVESILKIVIKILLPYDFLDMKELSLT